MESCEKAKVLITGVVTEKTLDMESKKRACHTCSDLFIRVLFVEAACSCMIVA